MRTCSGVKEVRTPVHWQMPFRVFLALLESFWTPPTSKSVDLFGKSQGCTPPFRQSCTCLCYLKISEEYLAFFNIFNNSFRVHSDKHRLFITGSIIHRDKSIRNDTRLKTPKCTIILILYNITLLL